jgi:hypothetical protein
MSTSTETTPGMDEKLARVHERLDRAEKGDSQLSLWLAVLVSVLGLIAWLLWQLLKTKSSPVHVVVHQPKPTEVKVHLDKPLEVLVRLDKPAEVVVRQAMPLVVAIELPKPVPLPEPVRKEAGFHASSGAPPLVEPLQPDDGLAK